MANKVFCSECKYVSYSKVDGFGFKCLANPRIKYVDTHFKENIKIIDYEHCLMKNENNDCKDFEPNFWKKFFTMFRMKMLKGEENASNKN